MRRYRHKQVVLFLAILILPSVAIALLGWRDFTREQEKRAGDAAERVKADIRRELLQALEQGIKLQEISGAPRSPAVVLAGRVEGSALVFPWDADRAAVSFREPVTTPAFRRSVLEAGRAEYVEKRFDLAADRYQELIQNAQNEGQRMQAQALLAGVLMRSGGAPTRGEALGIWRDLLKKPSHFVNESGIPFSYIAATALGADGGRDVLTFIAKSPDFPDAAPPSELPVLQPVFEALTRSTDAAIAADAADALDRLTKRMTLLSQAEGLRRDFPKLNLTAADWRSYTPPSSKEVWLLSLTSESIPRVIAVRAETLFRDVVAHHQSRDGDPTFKISSGGSGTPLGDNLPDLRIALEPAARPSPWTALFSDRPVYVLSLILVVLLTFVGGYLLWRDTRREIRLADLRTQFVSSVSHELKTPLTGIRMFAELMQMQGPAGRAVDAQRYNEHLDTIVNETERLSRLLNNVLDFSRIERGDKAYTMRPAILSEVVDAAARAMRFPLAQRGFKFRMEVAEDIPPACVDRDAVEQAVLNLLSNAMKYSGESREINLRLSAENGNAAIQVSDRGVGIPPEEHRKIFERFYRVPTPDNLAISGTGLGLSLVAHIVEAHGGRVAVQSAVGQGSTFTLYFPIRAEAHS